MKFKNFSLNLETSELKLTGKLAYILGAMRDGSFIRNDKQYTYRIRIYQKNKVWIERTAKILKELFGKKPTISLDERDNVWNLMVNSKKIYEKLVNISNFSDSQKDWNTPKVIINAPPEIQKEYIRGFFDSEGGVPHAEKRKIEPKNIRVDFTQSNKKCLEELREIIQKLGMRTGKVCGPYYKKGFELPVYRLKIHGIKEVSKFFHVIGSLHPEKQKRLFIISKTDPQEA